jgi:hypothetical protein
MHNSSSTTAATAIMTTPPTSWAPNTAASELAASTPALPARIERRRTAAGGATIAPARDCIRVSGVVFTDAHVRMHTAGSGPTQQQRGWLQVVIVTPGEMLWLASEELGTNPTAHLIASRRAGTLRRGMPCTVYAQGAAESTLHGQSVVVLAKPTIVLDHIPTPAQPDSSGDAA